MATAPKNLGDDDSELEASYEPPQGHRLPGWTVDALLEEGKVEEARAELERLLIEGASHPPSEEPFEDFIGRLRERGRQAAARRG